MSAILTKSPARIHEWTAHDIVAAVRARKATCEDVAHACLERIQEREPHVDAWQYVSPDKVLSQARALDRNGAKGPLAGVPFGVKDIIDTADMPTEYGSPIYAGHQPKADASCVALARKAGAVLMGKTVTTEFANRHPGKTRHPMDPTRTPGGSSSGSAAAVGDRMVPLAIGTQTTGSTIKPGSFNGVFAYRPTWGDLRCVGVKEAAGSLDTLGLYARSVEDIALFRDVLLGIDPQPMAASAPAPAIGFCRTPLWSRVEPATQKMLEDAARQLANAGAKVEEVTLPPLFDQAEESHRTVSSYEFSRNFTWEIEHHWDKISDTLRNGRLKIGLARTFDQYLAARNHAERCREALAGIFRSYDVLFAPVAVGVAPVGLASTGNSSLCSIWTLMHVPAMNVPVFRGEHGLPIGAQVISARNDDRKLFSAARWIYQRLT